MSTIVPPSKAVAQARGRVAGLSSRNPDSAVLPFARRDLAIELLAEQARRIVDTLPAPTPEQVDRLSSILRGGANA